MRTRSTAQNPIAVAAAVRTNWARVIPNFVRARSVSRLARSMIARWATLGGGGKYSSFEHGITSTGRSSESDFHPKRFGLELGEAPLRRQLIALTRSPRTRRACRDGCDRST